MEKIVQTNTRRVVVLIVSLALFSGVSAAGQMQVSLGNMVKLSGYSYSGDTVYLFLTGPNLPSNGVALDNINRLADNGGGTRVDVDADGHWVYQWNTGSAGGKLDAGTYTVWVADGPADRSHLSTVEYSTISVSLSTPSLTAGINGGSGKTPEPPQGSMDFTVNPDGTSVVINNAYKGMTPLNVSGLNPGTYNVTLSRFGYAKLSMPVTVQAGSISVVKAALVALTGSLFVNTTPAGAQLTLDSSATGISPATFSDITMGDHLLNVSKEGYVTQNIPVTITADQTKTVEVVLLPSVTGLAGFLPFTAAAGAFVALMFARKRIRQ
jgi:PEGA domain